MRILITGNMGYIGPSVVKQLRKSYPQATLVGLDAGYFAHCLTATPALPECRVDLQYFADVRWPPLGALERIDAIVHLSAISNDPMGNRFEDVTLAINHRASVDLAAAAKIAGVGVFVFASSCSMYGSADDSPKQESSPLNPLTAYAMSKVLTERDLVSLADDSFRVTSLRFSTACGMSERLRLDLVVNDFVACAVAAGEITILSDGTPWRPLIHVDDMARAIDWALQREPSAGADFLAVNIGSRGWNFRVSELAETVAEVIPGVTVSVNQDAAPDKRSYKVDFDLFERLAPDHQPQVDLRTAIQGLKQGLDTMGFEDSDFRSSTLMRLNALNRLRQLQLLDDELRWMNKPLPDDDRRGERA
jgi:nucleoside-diphosphate-sugar epimerase